MMHARLSSYCLPFVLSLFFCGQSIFASECCDYLLLDDVSESQGLHPLQGNRLGFYEKLGEYEARPSYRQLNGDFFLFYSSQKQAWVDTQFFFGAILFSRLENRVQSYCLEDYAEWAFYNNSQMEFTEDLKVSCSRVEAVCCHKLRISSSNSENSSYYGEENSKVLGDYIAIGTQNGRYLYQQKDEDRFLEYEDRNWIVSTGVGKSSGHLNHLGGSVCPEHVDSGWQVSQQDSLGNWGWIGEPGVKVTCFAVLNKFQFWSQKRDKQQETGEKTKEKLVNGRQETHDLFETLTLMLRF